MSTATTPEAQQTPAQTPAQSTAPLVLTRREGAITRITLNRPRALNALTRDMFALIGEAIAHAQTDGSTAIVLDGEGDRGFCGGGDIKQLSGPGGHDILELEYGTDYAVATSRVPVIGFMHGITMGGGIGLAGHAHHRIVTETSRLAMPEARIGIAPDVGGHLLLARAPQLLGEYLAVTSGEMTGADAVALGFADHLVPAAKLDELRAALAAGDDPATACLAHAVPDRGPAAPLLATGAWWAPLASAALGDDWRAVFADPVAAADRLVAALESAGGSDAPHAAAAAAAAQEIRTLCPTSIVVTLGQLARTRGLGLTLAETLTDDLRVLGRLLPRPDFVEGVRAQLIDKDRDPKWDPATLDGLDPVEISRILDTELRAEESELRL